jgi:crotonobetainyl-CoA:carnitine CoA-transferase CaiB-like acyl-CoA transferase
MANTPNEIALNAYRDLIAGVALPETGEVSITEHDPVFPMPLRFGAASAAALAALGQGVARLSLLRGGPAQNISVSARDAAAAMRGILYFQLNGKPPGDHRDPVAGFYPVRDGRWIYFHCYFPAHRDAALKVLGATDRASAEAKTREWDGVALESAIHDAGGVAGLVRTRGEWEALDVCRVVRSEPIVEITRIGDAPPMPMPRGRRPLGGVRVLDLTRILAGPVCTRTLAEHGADVLRITGEHLPHLGALEFDYGAGKLSAHLDLRTPQGCETLKALVHEGDVFCQSYRPGSLARRGFGPEQLAAMRPGIIYVTLDAFGFTGPWKNRRGYDSVVQMMNGMTHGWCGNMDAKGASPSAPTMMPSQPMDYGTGYLLAFGTMVALARRAIEGGSWQVRVSLARVGEWITDMGEVDPVEVARTPKEIPESDIQRLTGEYDTVIGRVRYVKPVIQLSHTPPFLERPSVPMGNDPPSWPPRR